MTCIIGLKVPNKTYMASDSAITLGGGIMATAGTKILKTDDMMIGVSGPRIVFNLLADKEYVFAGNFDVGHLNRIHDCLRQITPANTESEMLVAANQELFWIGNIAGWRVVQEQFECIGNGSQIAKGAMAMGLEMLDHTDVLLESLDIASKYCVGIAKPFQIECIEYE